MKITNLIAFACLLILSACNKEDDSNNSNTNPQMSFQFKFDANQERLDGFGNPATIPDGHAGQSPEFNSMSVHYIEFVPNQLTPIEGGAVVYTGETQTAESSSQFDDAIKWDEAIVAGADQTFLTLDLSTLPPGTYEYLRASVTYQNANVKFNLNNLPAPLPSSLLNQSGTLAGFIGFNTHVDSLIVKNHTVYIGADKPQGFWAFETQLDDPYQALLEQYADPVQIGQSPAGATTVVNPLSQFGITLPQGSCIVTGALSEPLVITGEETEDVTVTLSFSVNKSFEWIDTNGNGEWDGNSNSFEQVVDMGLRGLEVGVN